MILNWNRPIKEKKNLLANHNVSSFDLLCFRVLVYLKFSVLYSSHNTSSRETQVESKIKNGILHGTLMGFISIGTEIIHLWTPRPNKLAVQYASITNIPWSLTAYINVVKKNECRQKWVLRRLKANGFQPPCYVESHSHFHLYKSSKCLISFNLCRIFPRIPFEHSSCPCSDKLEPKT